MEGKKISFGFMKTKKADKPISDNNDDKKDYIECVEEQSIKIVGGEKLSSNAPLVIPMKPNTLIKPGRLREIALKVEDGLEGPAIKIETMDDDKIPDPSADLIQDAKKEIKIENPIMAIPTSTKSDTLDEPEIKTEPMEDDNRPDPQADNETLEQMAVRELIEDAKKEIKVENPLVAIPTSSKGVADGEKESTLDDYDAVPVQEFGLAMLRGMGWTPGQASSKYKQPELRPKGLGLGADKVIKAKTEASSDSKQEELVIVKNSYVKIVSGKYSDYYGKVVSLDEENGRVLVDIPLKKESVSLSEFMMVAVTKSEYDKESKVIRIRKGSIVSVDKKREIIELYEKKVPIVTIAKRLHLSRTTVYFWIKRWKEEGNINAHIPSGRPRKLSANKETTLVKQIGQIQPNVSDLGANLSNDNINFEKKKEAILKQNTDIIATIEPTLNLGKGVESKQSKDCKRFQRSGKDELRPTLKQKNPTEQQKPQSYVELVYGTSMVTSTNTIDKICEKNIQVFASNTKLHEISSVKEQKEINENEASRFCCHLSEVQKEEIVTLYKQKHPIAVIAECLNIARYAVELWIKRWKREVACKGWKWFGRPPKLSPDDEIIWLQESTNQEANTNLSDLAKIYGVSKGTIRRMLRHNGIPFEQTGRKEIPTETRMELERNEVHSETKKKRLNDGKKIEILTLYQQKHSISAIARHLKLSKDTVRLWIRRWQGEGTIEAHVPSGRPRKLSTDAEAILKDQIPKEGPLRLENLASLHDSESYEEYKRKESSEKYSRQEEKKSYLRQDGKERGKKEEKENDGRDDKEKRNEKVKDEKERDRGDEKERDRRDAKERDRGDEKERDRRVEKERERRDEKERDRRDEKERGRKDEKERNRKDEKERVKSDERDRDRKDKRERRDEREREKRSEKELERRPDKVRESRDERQIEDRNERERGRKAVQSESDEARSRRDQESANAKYKNRQKRDSSSSEDRSSRNKKTKKRYSSSDSLSSLSEDDRKQQKHSKNKSRRKSRSRSDSCKRSPAPEAKRDIDKKRKGKKKKRDRDRSPNYKKYRK